MCEALRCCTHLVAPFARPNCGHGVQDPTLGCLPDARGTSSHWDRRADPRYGPASHSQHNLCKRPNCRRRRGITHWALRIALGIVPIVAGADKFTILLTNWPGYVSPFAARLLPMGPAAFMHVVGVIEIMVGAARCDPARVLRHLRLGGEGWLLAIVLELLTTGRYSTWPRETQSWPRPRLSWRVSLRSSSTHPAMAAGRSFRQPEPESPIPYGEP